MGFNVLGVLNGGDMPLEQLRLWSESADLIIAADGGANRLIEAGFVPTQIVGDFDSVAPEALRSGALLVRDPNQDRTDCDKLFALVRAGGYGDVTIACAEGDLPDHVLATLQSAVASGLRVRVAYRRGIGWILNGAGSSSFPASIDARVSFLPLTVCSGVTLTGVHWVVSDSEMAPWAHSSVSNRATSERIEVTLGSGAGLLFVSYTAEEMPFW